MNRLALFRLLRHNQHLGFRRSPAFEQGMIAKVLSFLGGCVFVVYLIIIGSVFGLTAKTEGAGMLMALMPFVVIIDFFMRFIVQQTPDMLVKPYMLLPMSKYAVIECFLLTSLTSIYNFLWLFLPISFSVMALIGGCPWYDVLLVFFGSFLVILINSQFYLLMRTFINRSLWWWLVALPILAFPFIPCLAWDIATVFDYYSAHGTHPLLFLGLIAILAMLTWFNRKLQFRYVYEEISKVETTRVHVADFTFLNRYGEIGEYLKLEIKSVMRNKAMRAKFWSSLGLVVVFSALIAYTPIYNDTFSTHFWCFYCFALYGVTSLVKIMCPEGNYIDLLMTHRENILSLLRAKYYFHCAILVVPFVIMLPAVIMGKFTLLMMMSYLTLSAGFVYFILFHLAIYNNQTMPLEQKMTGKGNIENGRQLIIELVAFIVPALLVTLLQLVFSQMIAFLVQSAIGVVFMLTHSVWLRSVYRHMMIRRYENLEGFYASR